MLVAGDIGGTKTDLAIFSPEKGPRTPLAEAEYHSANYPSLEAMVREFLKGIEMPVDTGCFDVAGPVVEDRAKITNLPWTIDAEVLKRELKLKSVYLLNDLEATARAVPILKAGDLHTINEGRAIPEGSLAVVAPGTGLGEGFLTWDGSRYRAHASEGGHADFAPIDSVQVGLLAYLQKRFGHVSVERVCSGSGLPGIYDYLKEINYAPETPEVAAELAAAGDRTPVIVEAARRPENACPLCTATLDMFVSILAAECSNMALKVLSTGGIYLGGGLPKRIVPLLERKEFMQTFTRKGRFTALLSSVPIHIIMEQAALIGAASYGLEMMREGSRA